MTSIVQWHEGMLISPHHFQQSMNYLQDVLGQTSALSSPFGYGLFDIKIDTASLTSGLVRVLRARGVFQDGLFFDFDAVRDNPVELDLSEYFVTNNAATKIYLAIPARRSGENMLDGELARYYSAEIADVRDENTGTNAISVPILKPNLKLLRATQVDERYQSFPIFEAEKSADGGVVGTKFIAPFLKLSRDSRILGMCREVVKTAREKIAYFADRKDNFARNSADEALSNLRLLIQSTLSLEALINVPDLHPFEIYKNLLRMAADVVSMNPSQLVPRLPIYHHNDMFASFHQLSECICGVLNRLKQKYDIIPFAKEDDEFKLVMQPDWLSKDEIAIGILKPVSASDSEIMEWISGLQIASESMMPMIKDRRILGAERRILERGEYITQPIGMTIIAAKAHTVYIRPNENLCLTSSARGVVPEEVILYAERE